MEASSQPSHVAALGTPRGMPGVLEFPCTAIRLDSGNTLIADAGDEVGVGSEVIEVDPVGQIVWRFAEGLRFVHSAVPTRGGHILIADTTNDRVIEVSHSGEVVWSTDGLELSDGSRLVYPNNALEMPDGNLLITDRNNDRCLIVDRAGSVIWQYTGELKHPHGAEPLPNGNVLIADSDGNRIVEVAPSRKSSPLGEGEPSGDVVWSYGDGSPEVLSWPRHARRLENGNTLITDSKNARVIEVTPDGETAWTFGVDYFAKFYYAEVGEDDRVLIADQQGHRVLEVDRAGNIVWMFRNYVYPNPILPRLRNGSFKGRDERGWPEDWILSCRLSEGGGEVIWDEAASPRPCPGLSYDRSGALFLQQTVRCASGLTYHMVGQLRTEGLDGHACLQMSFVDAMGAAVADALEIPRGQSLNGTNEWVQHSFQATAPPGSTALEARLFITGRDKAWVKGLLLHT